MEQPALLLAGQCHFSSREQEVKFLDEDGLGEEPRGLCSLDGTMPITRAWGGEEFEKTTLFVHLGRTERVLRCARRIRAIILGRGQLAGLRGAVYGNLILLA